MNLDRNRTERLQDFLDGLLAPAERARVEARLLESPEWRREHRRLAAVRALLETSLDVEPPADLVPDVLAAVRARPARRRLRLPAPLENGFVLAGATALAAVVLGVGRVLPGDPAGWAGRATVAATSALGALKESFIGMAGSVAQLDWIARLATTLVHAGGTVLTSSAQPLMTLALATVALASVVAFVLLRTERAVAREGGIHVGLLA